MGKHGDGSRASLFLELGESEVKHENRPHASHAS
jgi:hypothetical protein